MITLLAALLTASAMLTVACFMAAVFLWRVEIAGARWRQALMFGVLLQGLMLFRLPVELPWLTADDSTSAASLLDKASVSAAAVDVDFSRLNDAVRAAEHSHAATIIGGASLDAATAPSAWFATHTALEWLVLIVSSLWLAGLGMVVVSSAKRYLSLCRLVGHLQPVPPAWQHEWKQACQSCGQRPPMMLLSETAGPMLVRRPRGYVFVVPRLFWQSLSRMERRGVMLHECAHLSRHDVWRQLIVRLVAALHWWNPAAWWCVRRYEESAEWSCDESLASKDSDAAHGLASSLIRLVEFHDCDTKAEETCLRGLGVQSMAAPPLTARVTRLLNPSSHGDPPMKRLLLGTLAAALLILSTVQFRLVAADPVQAAAVGDQGSDAASELNVLSADSKQRLRELVDRLDTRDKATSDLKRLLERETGMIAFLGMVDVLQDRYREAARGEAIPRFVESHFQAIEQNKLILREESREIAQSWVTRSAQLGSVIDSMRESMNGIADKLDESSDVNRLAQRMLRDEHAAFVILIEEFDGRSEPIEMFIGKAMERVLVQRGDKLVVIPTLNDEQRRQLQRFEVASEVAERLSRELPVFAAELAKPDKRHERLIAAMQKPAMAAIVALHATESEAVSAAATVDKLFEQLEKLAEDTADGLVIENEKAWQDLEEILDTAARAEERVAAVRVHLGRVASQLDKSDPMTSRFASQLEKGVIAYQVAAEVPYAEFDLGQQIESRVSQALEPAGADKLRVRGDAEAELRERANELLAACRTVRRYLRRVDTIRDSLADRELADALAGPGRLLLLAEIRRQAEGIQFDAMDLLEKEFFEVDEQTDRLTVQPERTELVGQLVERAQQLESELKKDDF